MSSLEHVDEVLFLGDVAGGRQSKECIEHLKRNAVAAVKGNHDLWDFELIGLPRMCTNFLADLPLSLEREGFVAMHSLFAKEKGGARFYYVRDCNDATRVFEQFTERVIFLGHTHEPRVHTTSQDGISTYQVSEDFDFVIEPHHRYIVNVGAAKDCVVIFHSDALRVSFRFLREDKGGIDSPEKVREKET